jgi:hypothetical protein
MRRAANRRLDNTANAEGCVNSVFGTILDFALTKAQAC